MQRSISPVGLYGEKMWECGGIRWEYERKGGKVRVQGEGKECGSMREREGKREYERKLEYLSI